ncbi:hypothetical protein F385_2911 [Pantoea agglomerans 299R]|nr:hypothetical protein F385_2911 [Pantoea agglomerans 299R]
MNRLSTSRFKQLRIQPDAQLFMHGIKFQNSAKNYFTHLSHPAQQHPALTRHDKVELTDHEGMLCRD